MLGFVFMFISSMASYFCIKASEWMQLKKVLVGLE